MIFLCPSFCGSGSIMQRGGRRTVELKYQEVCRVTISPKNGCTNRTRTLSMDMLTGKGRNFMGFYPQRTRGNYWLLGELDLPRVELPYLCLIQSNQSWNHLYTTNKMRPSRLCLYLFLHRQTYIYVIINQEKEAVALRVGCHRSSLRTGTWAELEGSKGVGESSVILFQLKTFKKKKLLLCQDLSELSCFLLLVLWNREPTP